MNPLSTAYHYLRAFWAIIRLNRDNQRTDLVFMIADSLLKLGKFQELHRIVQANPAALKIIKEKKQIKISLEDLVKFSPGSLGKVYADHMLRFNLDPEFYPRPETITDETYILLRLRQTHDLWHVVTGFDTSPLGEISLQSFMLAQMGSPVSIMIVGSAILRSVIKNQERLSPLMDGITNGWRMGKQANPLFPYDWESAWTKDLESVRKELNVS